MNREIHKALPLLLGVCALGGSAFAQDSTSLLNSMPGDALDPTSTTEQVNDYVVDVAAFQSTSGRTYGVAPLAKAGWDYSTGNHNFFTASISAQSISRRIKTGVPFVRSSYDYWNAPGTGVNGDPTRNNPGTAVVTSALTGNQFGYVFSQFSSDDPNLPTINFNSVVGGTVNYETTTPSRLYVSRIMGAGNDKTWSCNVAQFGVGSVDADGWISVRADGFGTVGCGGYASFTANNYFLIDLLSRSAGAVNILSLAGADDTGTWALVEDATTHSPTSMIPSAVTGGTPILLGSNFAAQFVYGAGPMTSTSGHFGAGVTDHRGLVSYSEHSFPAIFGAGSTHGSAGQLGVSSGTNALNLWGLSSAGAPVGPVALVFPGNGSISDPETAWSPSAGAASFANYYSSTAFRGGTGQVALGKDQAGRLLAAAMMHHPSFVSSTNANNLIAVARTSNGSAVEWVVAAYTEGNDGKPVHGAFGSTVIGKLVAHEPGGSALGGPSVSSPMIDSVGNVYFNGRVQLTGDAFYRESLVRAVYVPATFEYRLELVLSEGDVVAGVNSNRNYQIQFLQISGSSGGSPSAPFSQNISQHAYQGQSVAGLDPADNQTLGGVVIRATIIYDIDQDGDYDRQEIDPLSSDQDYQTLLYITSAVDCNSNGVPDDIDLADGTSLDSDQDGVPDECGAGTPFCLGDGTGPSCPCGNFGASGEGCTNSTGSGALLFTFGTNSIGNDDLGFNGSQLPPGKPSMVFSGNAQTIVTPFGDGTRCVGGAIKRHSVLIASGAGTATWVPSLQPVGGWGSGDTRYFQIWYRDPVAGPCAGLFNTSSGVIVTFVP
jgi:hypothetical protein